MDSKSLAEWGKKRRARLKAERKCNKCLADLVDGEVCVCQKCLQKDRDRRIQMIAQGLCVRCSNPRGEDGTTENCRKCANKRIERNHNKYLTPEARVQRLINSYRAKTKGLEFSITIKDLLPIPLTCPYSGCILDYSGGFKGGAAADNAPSLDRIDSNQGYIPGNVEVISKRINVLKNNGTIAEFQAIINRLQGLGQK